MSKDKTPFDTYWECPKMRCHSMLIFDTPFLPCAKHGDMVRSEDIPRKKRAYKAYRRLSQRYAFKLKRPLRYIKNATNPPKSERELE